MLLRSSLLISKVLLFRIRLVNLHFHFRNSFWTSFLCLCFSLDQVFCFSIYKVGWFHILLHFFGIALLLSSLYNFHSQGLQSWFYLVAVLTSCTSLLKLSQPVFLNQSSLLQCKPQDPASFHHHILCLFLLELICGLISFEFSEFPPFSMSKFRGG